MTNIGLYGERTLQRLSIIAVDCVYDVRSEVIRSNHLTSPRCGHSYASLLSYELQRQQLVVRWVMTHSEQRRPGNASVHPTVTMEVDVIKWLYLLLKMLAGRSTLLIITTDKVNEHICSSKLRYVCFSLGT